METYSFIGSDKNAGKTTAFNFVYKDLIKSGKQICLTSIGINGEFADTYEGHEKPLIKVVRDCYFVTSCDHLNELTGKYEIVHIFPKSIFGKSYLLGKTFIDTEIVLEGPNNGKDILEIKKVINFFLPDVVLLIDGSIDRQFLGMPEISDGFYFSFLVTERAEQINKANDILKSIKLAVCPKKSRELIIENRDKNTKSLIIDGEGSILYRGSKIPFMDTNLKDNIKEFKDKNLIIYINGALSKSFYGFLMFFKNISIVLDNFTQYQNVSVSNRFIKNENIFILNEVIIKKIFLKQETPFTPEFPENIPVQNIFRRAI